MPDLDYYQLCGKIFQQSRFTVILFGVLPSAIIIPSKYQFVFCFNYLFDYLKVYSINSVIGHDGWLDIANLFFSC